MTVELAEIPIDPASLLAAFSAGIDGEGAIASFTGYARSRGHRGEEIVALVLESYRRVTLDSMKRTEDQALDRFQVARCMIVHRTGRVLPGEPIVVVAVSAFHRKPALEAVEYIMDRLKTEAVFWKREEGPVDIHWVEATDGDKEAVARWSGR